MRFDFMPIFPAALAHAEESPYREVCGLVTVSRGRLVYQRCRNVAHADSEFEIHPEDYIDAEALGIVGVVHSHLHGSAEPSMADRVGCERSGLPWFIVAASTGACKTLMPEGYKAPLIGRPYYHGVLDCFSLVRDWYAEQGIAVPFFEHEPQFWQKGFDLLTPENFIKAGFRVVTDGSLQPGDGIIMQNGHSDRPNHCGVYLGDGVFLHHAGRRLSGRDPYGGYWLKVTRYIVRHESKC